MLRNLPAIGFCNYQNVNIADKYYDNIKEAVIRSVQCNSLLYTNIHGNVRSPSMLSGDGKRSLMPVKAMEKNKSLPKNLSVLSSRQLFLEMREQIVAQTELFLETYAHDYYTPISKGINSKFFLQWLDMNPYIRSIIRETFMPRMWSLHDGCAVKKIILPLLPN